MRKVKFYSSPKIKMLLICGLIVGLSLSIAGCKWPWEDDDDDNPSSPTSIPTVINMAGRWMYKMKIESFSGSCPAGIQVGDTDSDTMTITQDGSEIYDSEGDNYGTINTSTGDFFINSYEDDGGTFNLTGSTNGATMSGTFVIYGGSCNGRGTFTGNKL